MEFQITVRKDPIRYELVLPGFMVTSSCKPDGQPYEDEHDANYAGLCFLRERLRAKLEELEQEIEIEGK